MKKIFSLLLVFTTILVLCACGTNKENLVGTWAGAWDFMGHEMSRSFTLSKNGQYTETTLGDGKSISSKDGTWEFRDGKLFLHENGDLHSSTVYKYQKGRLVNNVHEFFKQGL